MKHQRGKFRSFAAAALLVILAAAAGTLAAGPAKAAAADAAATQVTIDNFSFTPAKIEVAAGTTVTWLNRDDIPHTVVSTEKVFKSKALDSGDKFTFTFAKAGHYPYFCSLHPKMTGEVIVH